MMDNQVWLVFTEEGEYENYSRDLQGVFVAEKLADDFAHEVGGQVEEWAILDSPPVKVPLYVWTDHIAPNGTLSPDKPWGKGSALTVIEHLGRARAQWVTWDHLNKPVDEAVITDWDSKEPLSRFVRVSGTDKEQVKAEHRRLVAQVRAEQKSRGNHA